MYDSEFFKENVRVGMSAARVLMPYVIEKTNAITIIDIGCGPATFLSMAKLLGCKVHGVDGYAPDEYLLINKSEFTRQDLQDGNVSCKGYDLAMCLEFGEHIPESSADALVRGLCEARYVFWSAAIPGQNGVNHINEQWPSWWAPKFAERGYVGSCDIRRAFWNDRRVAGFYRQNAMIYAKPRDLDMIGMTQNVLDEVHPDRALGY